MLDFDFNVEESENDNISFDDIVTQITGMPIGTGIGTKNYGYLKSMLNRGVGGIGRFHKTYFGTPRGVMVNIHDDDKNPQAWFYHDGLRQYYSDYIAYVEDNYYYGRKCLLDFASQEEKARFYNPNDKLLENNKIGVIRGYNYRNEVNDLIALNHNGYCNPNGMGSDTRLGTINNFYLNHTLNLAHYEYQKRKETGISKDAYELFGLDGLLGIESSVGFIKENGDVRSNDEVTRISDNLTLNNDGIGNWWGLNTQLLEASNDKVANYTMKSLLGIDLLSDDVIEIDKLDMMKYPKRKYRPSIGAFGLNYIDTMTYDGSTVDVSGERYDIKQVGNENIFGSRVLWAYAESEGNKPGTPITNKSIKSYNDGIAYGKYYPYSEETLQDVEDLLYKTNKNFQNAKYDTLIARFHTNTFEDGVVGSRANTDTTNTAVSQYGTSHGRNLLKKDHKDSKTNGYSNPYCRVWTYHHQYSTLQDTIRPFDEKDVVENEALNAYRRTENLDGYANGTERLYKLGVKGKNGLVRFTPYRDDNGSLMTRPEQCMFSIENLAWKGLKPIEKLALEEEQIGPLGGRIMWFPPYALKFNENVSTNWNSTDFIGRGEHIYTYTNTERGGNLSFKMLVDHPSLVNSWRGIVDGVGDVDDVDSTEQTLLRFFAGCEMLDGRGKQEKKTKTEKKNKDVELRPLSIPVVPEPKKIIFNVYFPNNYSGIDDIDADVNPIHYLLNGCYSNKEGSGVDDEIRGYDVPVVMSEVGFGYEMGDDGITQSVKPTTTEVKKDGTTYIPFYRGVKQNADKKNINLWYRNDESRQEEILEDENYVDKKSYRLNNDGYTINPETSDNVSTWCSLTQMYLALYGNFANFKITGDPDAQIVKNIIDNKKILRVHILGKASSHGNKAKNRVLAGNRATVIENWMEKHPKFKDVHFEVKIDVSDEPLEKDVSLLDAKIWRSVRVEVEYSEEELTAGNTPTTSVYDENPGYVINRILTEEASQLDIEEYKNHLRQKGDFITLSKVSELWENALQDLKDQESNVTYTTIGNKNERYKNEYLFFSELEKNEPLLHSKLVEKIKYFDPAFHSITPEGFHSRLTFLHQCTRQGGTHSNNDDGITTADNLSFGRPPVCVLRIGDFFYTKILIKSINMKYDEASWDLNDEGIGVMPMMADIDINFTFIGGSDLGGPITRLQNALSFNYYANTGVYDNRAEMVTYNEDKSGKMKGFTQINMMK